MPRSQSIQRIALGRMPSEGMKTMQRYIRLAGIDEAGATEVLRFIPTEEAVMEKVVSLYGVGNKGDLR